MVSATLRRQARRLERVFQRTRRSGLVDTLRLFHASALHGERGRKRANTGSTRSLPVRGTLDGFGLPRISLVGLGPPAHRRLLSRLKHSSITTRPSSLPSARTWLTRRNQPSHLQHLALLPSPCSIGRLKEYNAERCIGLQDLGP